MTKKKKLKLPNFTNNKQPLLWYVEWLDHTGWADGGWHTLKEIGEELHPVPMSSVGWVCKEDEQCICIVPVWGSRGETTGAMSIIKSTIIRTRKLADPVNWEVY